MDTSLSTVMRSTALIGLVGSLLSAASVAWAQELVDGTGYFRGPAAAAVTGDGTGYFRGVATSAPPPPRSAVATVPPAFTPYDQGAWWSWGLPSWSWLGNPLWGSRPFPYGYGMPRAPFYTQGRILDAPMHRRSPRWPMQFAPGYRRW